MKASEIVVGGLYTAKVSDKLTTVRVDAIWHESVCHPNDHRTYWDVTNLATGRKTTFRSAAKFRAEASGDAPKPVKAKADSTQFGAPQTGFPEDGGTVGGPGFLPETIGPHAPITCSECGTVYTLAGFGSCPECDDGEDNCEDSLRPLDNPELGKKFLEVGNETSQGAGSRPSPDSVPVSPSSVRPEQSGNAPGGSPLPRPQGPSGLAAKIKKPVTDDTPPHLVVTAYAGTGKTFTQIVGVAWAFGQPIWPQIVRTIAERINEKAGCQKVNPNTFKIVPSDEQQAVWDALALSVGQVKTITYCAFNKSIVTEFGEEWGWLVKLLSEIGITLQFATVNSLGSKAMYSAFGRVQVKDWHTEELLGKHLGKDPRELKRYQPTLVSAVTQLAGLCKLTLAGWTEEGGFHPDNITDDVLDELASHFAIEMNGERGQVYQIVPKILEMNLDVDTHRQIDFNDQNWLPVVLNLPISKVDLLLIDEGQDLPRCKQEFGRKLGRRIVLVGDVWQAIYGFAGADVDSIPRMMELLGNGVPLVPLKLTETRRCGKAIVAEAQKYVPDFRAHESNPEGIVRYSTMDKYAADCKDGDMCLCRANAPLVSQALRMIKAGRKAVIRGREFGTQLVSFIDKQKASDPGDLVGKIQDWVAREAALENKKRNPSEARLIALQDRASCVEAFCEGAVSIDAVKEAINLVFSGKECPKCRKRYNESSDTCFGCQVPLVQPKGIIFSSVHRAKGLEAQTVFILQPKGAEMPHPLAKSAWQRGQEVNCIYIAITRSISELVYVSN